MTIKRSIAIKRVLEAKTRPDLAALYTPDMEVQVNVAQDDGEKVPGDRGKFYYTDGVQRWSTIRIPRKAMSIPEDNDYEINFDLDRHAEAIGMTGWDWRNKVSKWVAFDFDAITGHSANHAATLTEAQLEEVKQAAMQIPWVTVRKSTGGRGLHLYVFVDNVPTANHTEHAALGRAILGLMSAMAGYDFSDSVDACGGNIWVWARKMAGTDGLTLIKQGEVLKDVPQNWRDHIRVTMSRGKRRNLPQFIQDSEAESFDELAGQRARVPLDDEHKKLIEFLRTRQSVWWWSADYHMLVCCTHDLKDAHKALSMRGVFDTNASGKDGEQNCFAFPIREGAWVVRRYSKGISETANWDQDKNGYTRCFLNMDPDLNLAARVFGGVEQEKGGFAFREAAVALKAAMSLGVKLDIPQYMLNRNTTMKAHKDGRLIVKINRDSNDDPGKMVGWQEEKSVWTRIYNVTVTQPSVEPDNNYDGFVRHIISESGSDAGWVIRGEAGQWTDEPLSHIKAATTSVFTAKGSADIVGNCVLRPWKQVTLPFKPEYPGNRCWNRNAAQLRFIPATEPKDFPHWSMILNHVGASLDDTIKLDPWCKDNGILSGHDYLLYWCAFLFREPLKKLPYLFFHGPQNSGKSSFHEALSLLFEKKRGYMEANQALTSQGGFNGELVNAVLCVIEEVDLSREGSQAYNRIKNWTTSQEIAIHAKFCDPYMVPNTCHFIQTGNKREFCYVSKNDTRITMSYVPEIEIEIPKDELFQRLEKEAPDFLGALYALTLPESGRRLALPHIDTPDKLDAGAANQSPLEQFLSENVFRVDGHTIKLADLYYRFKSWLSEVDSTEAEMLTKQKMSSQIPPDIIKGRLADGQWYFANVSFSQATPKPRLIRNPATNYLIEQKEDK